MDVQQKNTLERAQRSLLDAFRLKLRYCEPVTGSEGKPNAGRPGRGEERRRGRVQWKI